MHNLGDSYAYTNAHACGGPVHAVSKQHGGFNRYDSVEKKLHLCEVDFYFAHKKGGCAPHTNMLLAQRDLLIKRAPCAPHINVYL